MELPPYEEIMRLIQDRRQDLGVGQPALARQAEIPTAQLKKMERLETHADYATVHRLWEELQRMAEKEQTTAGEVMHDSIEWIEASQQASQAERIMYSKDYLQMPVKEETDNKVYKNVGSLTEADLTKTTDMSRPVGEIMGEPFKEIDTSTPLPQVEQLLKEGYNALLVTENSRYVGIITKSDLVRQDFLR